VNYQSKDHQKGTLFISVIDIGIGLTQENKEKIFQEFFQVNSSSTQSKGSLGLGLAIVDKIVRLLNGHVSIESQLGEGTAFTIELPVEADSTKTWLDFFPKVTSKKILYIGKKTPRQDYVVDALSHLGFNVSHSNQIDTYSKDLFKSEKVILDLTEEKQKKLLLNDKNLSNLQEKIILLASIFETEKQHELYEKFSQHTILYIPIKLKKLLSALSGEIENSSLQVPNPSKDSIPPGIKLLITEDDFDNQLLMKYFLEPFDANLHFALNGVDALKVLSENKNFDMIITDLHMPVMDGYELVHQIRKNKSNSHTPIIVLTADALSTQVSELSKQKNCSALTKPIEKSELFKLISEIHHS